MKQEQIEALGAMPGNDAEMARLARNALPRLLAERAALLEALEQAVETLDAGPDEWPYTKAPDQWREALTLAES